MATYKVIQDIEAEDKILGPLTLRQFIYALIAIFFLYLSFIVFTKGAPVLLAVFLPPGLFFGFLALPFGRDQPTEVWAVAKLRFWFKPRRRIWDQTGIKQLVTITAPKKIERNFTNGLSQTEVKSRLKALADTIDSRGWAIKNVDANLYQPAMGADDDSDRLISIGSIPQAVPDYDVVPSDDILDENSNPVAQQMGKMIDVSTKTHRQKLMEELEDAKADVNIAPGWFVAPSAGTDSPQPAATPLSSGQATVSDDTALGAQLKRQGTSTASAYVNMRTLRPTAANPAPAQATAQQRQSTSGKQPDPAIIELAKSNDLNVDTLARQAKKAKESGDLGDGEVVIPLH